MTFTVAYISFSILLSAYLIGNMTALIVKGSKTERFRDKMTDLIRYMNRNKLGAGIRSQVKEHLLLQYESSYTKDRVVDDIPVAVRSKVANLLHRTGEIQLIIFVCGDQHHEPLFRFAVVPDTVPRHGFESAPVQRMFRGLPEPDCKILSGFMFLTSNS